GELRSPVLVRPGLPVRVDDQQVGPHGVGTTGLRRRVAVHLAAPAQRPRRLLGHVPARVRGRAHRRPAAAAGGRARGRRARSRGGGPLLRDVWAARLRDRRAPGRRTTRERRVHRGGAHRRRPAHHARHRPGRRVVGRGDPGVDGRGPRADRQGRRHADPALPPGRRASGRGRLLRAGDQPAARRGAGGRALGPRDRARLLPGLHRAQAQPAGTTPAPVLRGPAGRGGHRGGLARRQPAPEAV
ncbi:MAG: hypothetical protein AVDCRST_MAG52-1591, partial [uncultured Blastococcus sp.]